MKSIPVILKKIRDLLPYFFLISIYFFFVNLEARKENNKTQFSEKKLNNITTKKSFSEKEQLRLAIPVIPYKDYYE